MQRVAIAFLISCAATAAMAGDGNQAYLIQLSPQGTMQGNTLSIDQEQADGSLVRGIGPNLIGELPYGVLTAVNAALNGTDPLLATQRGEGNRASVKMTGSGGELQLLQVNSPFAPWTPGEAGGYNVATLTATGNALGGVIQAGELNDATLSLGTGSTGLISQLGSQLSATLTVVSGGSGTVTQIGRGSTVAVNVTSDNSVTYTQIGNGLRGEPASVYSSVPGSITITQTAFGANVR